MTYQEVYLLDAIDKHFEEIVCDNKAEPKIVLTLKEAKEIQSALNKLCYVYPEAAKWAQKLEWMIMDKIEQAEAQND